MAILATYAVSLITEGALDLAFGSGLVEIQASYVNNSFVWFGMHLPEIYVYGFLLAAGLLGALSLLLYRTRFGRSVRAAEQNRTSAMLVGIPVERVSTIVFGIGVAVTAAGGMVFGATNAFNGSSGADLISRLLTIVILGGLGSMGGALAVAIAARRGERRGRRLVAGTGSAGVVRGPGRGAADPAERSAGPGSGIMSVPRLPEAGGASQEGAAGILDNRSARRTRSRVAGIALVIVVLALFPAVVTNPSSRGSGLGPAVHDRGDVLGRLRRVVGVRLARLRGLLRHRRLRPGRDGPQSRHGRELLGVRLERWRAW